MASLAYHYETMGRLLEHLVAGGLRRIDLETSDAMDIMTHRIGDEEEVLATFNDVVVWMLDEGLIRASSIQQTGELTTAFNGVQLASKGISLIQQKPDDSELGGSIEEKLTGGKKGELSTSVYVKIGSFVGGAVGGFTKAIS
ncbi:MULTISPECIES: hypothetical protein [unclassified Mesorhizobium]|uniref:hypothetical protein n=1 Tax=unclassified Mesorhizobium TaxID=325217 RepID=UPI001126D822|nr:MULTISPECIES: hypothetical protein [unclassified Mesorhizobium]TPK88666.1 hypothetical protein FJ548_12080 [Mesorhizobium sp. B2-4-17]TPK97622.1 hypothetical protein FJ938_26230 [Mesorhizobium sp. B2-4-14]